ncbi:MAG: glutathione S-transferase domain-containing protein [Cyanobacteria bacterium J06648_10]
MFVNDWSITCAQALCGRRLDGILYLLGNNISIADFYLIPIFVYISKTPHFGPITAEMPKLKAWWEKTQALDSVKVICG